MAKSLVRQLIEEIKSAEFFYWLLMKQEISVEKYHTCIKFCGLIFHVFDWQENLWGINFVVMVAW